LSLSELVASDVSDVFLNANDFAETVTYTPTGGSARTILAVVILGQSGLKQDQTHFTSDSTISVYVSNDATTGIDNPQLKDTITWGGVLYSFSSISGQDVGGWQLMFVRHDIKAGGAMSQHRF